jgi:hypothetical protein
MSYVSCNRGRIQQAYACSKNSTLQGQWRLLLQAVVGTSKQPHVHYELTISDAWLLLHIFNDAWLLLHISDEQSSHTFT